MADEIEAENYRGITFFSLVMNSKEGVHGVVRLQVDDEMKRETPTHTYPKACLLNNLVSPLR